MRTTRAQTAIQRSEFVLSGSIPLFFLFLVCLVLNHTLLTVKKERKKRKSSSSSMRVSRTGAEGTENMAFMYVATNGPPLQKLEILKSLICIGLAKYALG